MAVENFGIDGANYSDVVDEGSDYTITPNKVIFDTMQRNRQSWVLDDKGDAFFDGDFTHRVNAAVTTDNSDQSVCPWQLSNVADTPFDIDTANGDALFLIETENAGNKRLQIIEIVASLSLDTFDEAPTSDRRYYVMDRNEDVDDGDLTCDIFSDEEETIPVGDTLVLALRAKKDFKFGGCAMPFGDSSGTAISGDIQNLDLGIGIADGGIGLSIDQGLTDDHRVLGVRSNGPGITDRARRRNLLGAPIEGLGIKTGRKQ
jgi:hypothetical protein